MICPLCKKQVDGFCEGVCGDCFNMGIVEGIKIILRQQALLDSKDKLIEQLVEALSRADACIELYSRHCRDNLCGHLHDFSVPELIRSALAAAKKAGNMNEDLKKLIREFVKYFEDNHKAIPPELWAIIHKIEKVLERIK